MKMKRLLSGMLAAVMTLSLSIPALALDVGGGTDTPTDTPTTPAEDTVTLAAGKNEKSLKIKTGLQKPVITVVVPTISSTAPNVVFNPYKLKVQVGTSSSDVSQDQIASPQFSAYNLSECPVQVSVSVKAAVKGNVVLTNSAISDTETGNKVMLWFKGQVANSAKDAWGADTTYTVIPDATTAHEVDNFGVPSTDAAKAAANVLASGETGSPANASEYNVLAPAKSSTKAADAYGYFNFRLGGSAALNPDNAWTSKDTVSAEVAFTFTPLQTYIATTP